MIDQYGRTIDYLRLSVTDLCNYRCQYCMPADGVEKGPHGAVLSVEEYGEIARAAVKLGIRKIRLTGESRWCGGGFWTSAERCGPSRN